MLSRYFRGLLLQMAGFTVFITLFLSILGIKNALLIGFFAGLLNVVPYVGPIIGAVFGYAEGGIVRRPTLTLVGEGGESEAIIPLSKLSGMAGGATTVNVINNGPPVEVTGMQRRRTSRGDELDLMIASASQRNAARGFGREKHTGGVVG